MATGSFPGVECGRGVTLTPHPFLVWRSKKQSRAIPLPSLRDFVACKKGETYLKLKCIVGSGDRNLTWLCIGDVAIPSFQALAALVAVKNTPKLRSWRRLVMEAVTRSWPLGLLLLSCLWWIRNLRRLFHFGSQFNVNVFSAFLNFLYILLNATDFRFR
jgi:hypothetical protein